MARGVSDSAERRGVGETLRLAMVGVSELFEDVLGVGVDADLAGDLHRGGGDLSGRQGGVLAEGTGRRQGEAAARAYRRSRAVGLYDVAGPRKQQGLLLVGHQQEG